MANRTDEHKKAGSRKDLSNKKATSAKESSKRLNTEGARQAMPIKHNGSEGGRGQGNFSNH